MKSLIFLIFLTACSTVTQTLDTETLYKKDVVFWVNKTKIIGMGVAPKSEEYVLYFNYPKGQIDLLSLGTCHRQFTMENEEHKVRYLFIPTPIESESACPLDIGIYDKKGRHGWGYLIFPKDENTLEGKLECNGETIISKGVSVCQGQVGTIQRITFEAKVNGVASEGCEFNRSANSEEFEIEIARDFCYYSFVDSIGNVLDLTVYGYENFILRG